MSLPISTVHGIVMKCQSVGERDRRVTLLSLEQGKLSFFARGSARPGSMLLRATRPFSYGRFSLFQGRDSYSLESAEIDNYFEGLSADVTLSCYASYFLELMDYFNRELCPEPAFLRLLYRSFQALLRQGTSPELIRRVVELRSQVIEGSYLDSPPVAGDQALLYTWQYICRAPEEKLFSFQLSEELLQALARNVDRSMALLVDRAFHSLSVLEELRGGLGGEGTLR